MLPALGVVIAGMVITYWEGRSLWKKKKKNKKEIFVFILLLVTGVFSYIGVILDLPIPNPTDVIAYIFKIITEPIFSWIQGGDS